MALQETSPRSTPLPAQVFGLSGPSAAVALAGAFSAAMLLGAYAFEYIGGLPPCRMCHWQRWAHFAVVGLALSSLFVPPRRLWGALAVAALLVSFGVAGFHAGVEYGWWEGPKSCSGLPDVEQLRGGMGDIWSDLSDPSGPVSCADPAWSMAGISMAGWNAVLSLGAFLSSVLVWKRT